MYQYIAVLKSSQEKIAEGHSLADVEKEVTRLSRNRKIKEVHDLVSFYHIQRKRIFRHGKKKLVKEQPF